MGSSEKPAWGNICVRAEVNRFFKGSVVVAYFQVLFKEREKADKKGARNQRQETGSGKFGFLEFHYRIGRKVFQDLPRQKRR